MAYGSEHKFLPASIKKILDQVDVNDLEYSYKNGHHKSYADICMILLQLTQDENYRMSDDQKACALHPFKLFGLNAVDRLRAMQKGSDAQQQTFSTKAQREALLDADADVFKMLHSGPDADPKLKKTIYEALVNYGATRVLNPGQSEFIELYELTAQQETPLPLLH